MWAIGSLHVHYHRAILACTRALKGELPDDDARFLFTDAIEDARLPYVVSLNNASRDALDSGIAAICDAMAFEDRITQQRIFDRELFWVEVKPPTGGKDRLPVRT